jgi:Bifunctional DNA primase/polymerase, N-terminal
MTDASLRQALAYARCGWPVFPCLPGQKIPATRHGYLDASTDEHQIAEWFGRGFTWNLAIATGAPGPDVLDVDQHGEAGNGYPAFATLERAAWSTAPPPTCGPRPAGCTPTSPARTSTTAACPATTWTSAPEAATSWPRLPR